MRIPDRPNIVVVMVDTLRIDFLGCYGNNMIHTPNIDEFAEQSVKFTHVFPESLSTIPVRRAIHTGRRAYPFRDYHPVPWDLVYCPGWQPMQPARDCVAENLARDGYHTGLVTDNLCYFTPGFNFHRGFWQWEFIRGMQQDRWHSIHTVTEQDTAHYTKGDPEITELIYWHLANTAHVQYERQTCTARTFQWAMDFVEDNRNAAPFYLFVDSLAPHEPWDAPDMYYEMYADPDYDGLTTAFPLYTTQAEQGLSDDQVADMVAHYSGLVSLVDAWFGMFMDKLQRLDLLDNTVVFFTSDHGTSFADNPFGIIGKPAHSMWPGVMSLPLLVRMPEAAYAGKTVDKLVYNFDVSASVYELAGIDEHEAIDGCSVLPLATGDNEARGRPYVTCRYVDALCYIDQDYWIRTDVHRELGEAFDLRDDPHCQHNIADSLPEEVFALAWERIMDDADGDMPVCEGVQQEMTDAIGRVIRAKRALIG